MSEFNKDDKYWKMNILPEQRKLNEIEESILIGTFDQETEQDIIKIQNEINESKFLKKVCVYKLLLVVPEYILLKIFFNKKYSEGKRQVASLYIKFLFNKITLNTFKKELQLLLSNGKII
jgi:hypothetical protein